MSEILKLRSRYDPETVVNIFEEDLKTIQESPGFPICSLCRRNFVHRQVRLGIGGYLALSPEDDPDNVKRYWLCDQCGRRLGLPE